MAIDLSASYANAIRLALPHAVVVADRFHLVRLANDMLTEVRQHATRELRGRRGRARDPEWANRRRLLTAHERLRPETFARMWNELLDADEVGVEILHAYTVKERLRHLLDLAPTPGTSVPDRSVISHRLWRFFDQAAGCDIPEVHRLAETVETWWPPAPKATTGSGNTKVVTPSASATPETRNAAYAGPAPANTGGKQPSSATRCPVKFEEPHYLMRR